MRCAASVVALLALAVALPARGGGLDTRETAHTADRRWAYSVGVFNPLTFGVAPGTEFRIHPLLFLIAPNVVLRVAHRRSSDGWSITGEYGLSKPGTAVRLAQGNLFPTWDYRGGEVGEFIVPRAGIVASFGNRLLNVTTVSADFAAGIPLWHNDARPTQTYAPLELLLAPALRSFRGHLGGIHDRTIAKATSRWRGRAYVDIYLQGGEREKAYSTRNLGWNVDRTSLVGRLGVGADVGIGRTWEGRYTRRLTFGVAWYNYDQHAIDPTTFERHRSNDLYPTLDFIWQRW